MAWPTTPMTRSSSKCQIRSGSKSVSSVMPRDSSSTRALATTCSTRSPISSGCTSNGILRLADLLVQRQQLDQVVVQALGLVQHVRHLRIRRARLAGAALGQQLFQRAGQDADRILHVVRGRRQEQRQLVRAGVSSIGCLQWQAEIASTIIRSSGCAAACIYAVASQSRACAQQEAGRVERVDQRPLPAAAVRLPAARPAVRPPAAPRSGRARRSRAGHTGRAGAAGRAGARRGRSASASGSAPTSGSRSGATQRKPTRPRSGASSASAGSPSSERTLSEVFVAGWTARSAGSASLSRRWRRRCATPLDGRASGRLRGTARTAASAPRPRRGA